MCGRYTARFTETTLLPGELADVVSAFPPRYNIAPQQTAPVIRMKEGVPVFEALRWGFRPSWMKDPNQAQINARAETLFAKPMFGQAARNRRCLVLASGWYEWQHKTTGKQPFFFHFRDDRLFAMAGIWTPWHTEGAESQDRDSYAIITAAANPFAAPIHRRMPVILGAEACAVWLDASDADSVRLASLLAPHAYDDLDAYPVSTYVNSPQHDGRKCLEPLTH